MMDKPERIRIIGVDISVVNFLEEVLKRTENTEMKHYFYGTTQENLNSFVSTMKDTYPNLKIVGVEPSVFRPLSLEEENELLERINGSGADFVWVALGAPRQEMIPRAPQWMQNHGLEWFYRFMKEPRRLFKRYFVTNSKFLWYLFRDKGEK